MLRQSSTNIAKKWLKFSVKNRDGKIANFCIIQLPKDLADEFVNFQMKYFVARELTHRLAGIPKSAEAMDERKDIIKSTSVSSRFYNFICCPEVNGNVLPEIAMAASLKKIYRDDTFDFPKYKTKELNRYFEIVRVWDNLCPYSVIMEKYGAEAILDYYSLSVHPQYARHGLTNQIGRIMPDVLRLANTRLCGAWTTAEGTRKAAENHGWTTEFTIKTSELAKLLNLTFDQPPPPFFSFQSFRL